MGLSGRRNVYRFRDARIPFPDMRVGGWLRGFDHHLDLPAVFEHWNHGTVIRGWLVELMGNARTHGGIGPEAEGAPYFETLSTFSAATRPMATTSPDPCLPYCARILGRPTGRFRSSPGATRG